MAPVILRFLRRNRAIIFVLPSKSEARSHESAGRLQDLLRSYARLLIFASHSKRLRIDEARGGGTGLKLSSFTVLCCHGYLHAPMTPKETFSLS